MNDVKELCDLALEAPAPPPRAATEALAQARRSARTRDGVAGAMAAAAVVAAAALVAVPVLGADHPAAPTTAAASAPATAPPAPPSVPAVPGWKAAQGNGGRVISLLLGAVPAGYRGSPETTFTDGSHTATWLQEPASSGHYGSTNGIIVSAGARQGLLEAYLTNDGVAAATDDMCGIEMTARVDHFFGAGTGCHVIDVGGIPVRVSSRTDPDLGLTSIAVRMLDGGMVAVQATQHVWVFDTTQTSLPPDAVSHPTTQAATPPGLVASVFTDAQLAALAADPAMLP